MSFFSKIFSRKKPSKSEKITLLSSLLNDSDTIEFVEAEFQNRLNYVLDDINKELEFYLKTVSDLNERKDSKEKYLIALGRSEVCARIKTLLDIKMEKPSLSQGYVLINELKKRKNEIVDDELSEYFRRKGLKTEQHKMLKFEAKCADILENEWHKAFILGLECKDRIPEERIKAIRENEKEIKNDLLNGTYYYDIRKLDISQISNICYQNVDTFCTLVKEKVIDIKRFL